MGFCYSFFSHAAWGLTNVPRQNMEEKENTAGNFSGKCWVVVGENRDLMRGNLRAPNAAATEEKGRKGLWLPCGRLLLQSDTGENSKKTRQFRKKACLEIFKKEKEKLKGTTGAEAGCSCWNWRQDRGDESWNPTPLGMGNPKKTGAKTRIFFSCGVFQASGHAKNDPKQRVIWKPTTVHFPPKLLEVLKLFLKKDPNTKLRESGSRATDFFSPGGGKQKGGGGRRRMESWGNLIYVLLLGKRKGGGKEFVHGKLLNSAPLHF